MKKALISILGLAGGKYDKKEGAINFETKQYYYEDGETKEKKLYSNTLPYLIDRYGEGYEIIPIFTQEAKAVQSKILIENENKSEWLNIFDQGYKIVDENNFNQVLKKINDAISNYDRVIFDVTHGFRHLPILAIVNLIIQNIKSSEKIEAILFGKEIIKADKDTTGTYEIINLDEYLGLAKLSFVLVNFNTNYTVGNKLSFVNPQYQEIVDSLRIISGHILANSIKALIEGEHNLISTTINKLKKLQKEDEKIETFSVYIDDIVEHLNSIQLLRGEKDYVKLFKLSQMMKNREYLLNSITLLNESVGMFCTEKIKQLNSKVRNHIDCFLNVEDGNLYELAHQSKNIIKREKGFSGDYLYEPGRKKLTSGQKTNLQNKKRKLKETIPFEIRNAISNSGFKIELSNVDMKNDNYMKNIVIELLEKQDNSDLKELIINIENLRNNLAHGNTSDMIENVKGTITKLTNEYKKFIDEFQSIVSRDIPEKVKEKKIVKKKIVPAGIQAPVDKVSKLEDIFNNR